MIHGKSVFFGTYYTAASPICSQKTQTSHVSKGMTNIIIVWLSSTLFFIACTPCFEVSWRLNPLKSYREQETCTQLKRPSHDLKWSVFPHAWCHAPLLITPDWRNKIVTSPSQLTLLFISEVSGEFLYILSWQKELSSCDVTTRRHGVTAWRLDILGQLLGKNTDKEGASTLRRWECLREGPKYVSFWCKGHFSECTVIGYFSIVGNIKSIYTS